MRPTFIAGGVLVTLIVCSPCRADDPAPSPPKKAKPGTMYLEPPPVPEAPPELRDAAPQAEDAQPEMTLEALLELAAQSNPTLQQAQAQVDGTLGKAIEAGLYPNPVFMYRGEQIGVSNMETADTIGEFQGAIVRQEIPTAGKLRLSRAKYLQRAKSAEFIAVAQQFRVYNDVRRRFWQALGRQRLVAIRQELLESADDTVLTARELYNEGQATQADVHRANVELQRARLDLLTTRNDLYQALGELTAFVGIDLTDIRLAGELRCESPEIQFDTALERILAESPEILAAQAKLEADRITVQRERVQPIPNIFIQGGAGYNAESKETVAAAGVQFEVPIFDRNQGTIRQAQADLNRQQHEVRRVQLDLRRRLFMHYQLYLTSLQNAREFDKVILPEAQAAYKNQLESYKVDRQEWPEVLDAQRRYFDLQHRFIEHLITMRENQTLIEGFLLHGGLDAAPNPTPPGHIDSVPKPR